MKCCKRSRKAQGKSLPEQINIQCEAIKAAFDYIFGEGVGTAVCGYENDLLKCIDAYTALAKKKKTEQVMNEKNESSVSTVFE